MKRTRKPATSAQWATYELAYGGDDEYVAFSADKSMADIDTGFAEDKQFHDALGEEGMKKLRELEADCVESSDSELFSINPAQSYPPEAWVKAAPDFWKPKPCTGRQAGSGSQKARTVTFRRSPPLFNQRGSAISGSRAQRASRRPSFASHALRHPTDELPIN